MRIAMLSDFHIGYERFREDARRQAAEALELASNLADVILIPGDIFDFRNPAPDVIAEAINIFRPLCKKEWKARVTSFEGEGRAYTDVPIIAIPGTHERRAQNVSDPVDILGLAGLLVDISQAKVVVEKDGEKISVCGLGGIADERFREVVKEMHPRPVEGMFNILMFHQSLYELLPFSDDFMRYDELPEGFDLYVNGHIHGRVEAKIHGKPFLISGSTVLTQLKEKEQEPKGFYVYDTKTGEHRYHNINSRKFILAKVSIEGMEPTEAMEGIREKISALAKGSEMPIIKIDISGRLKAGFKSMDFDTSGIVSSFAKTAIVEIGRPEGDSVDEKDVAKAHSLLLDGTSIRDFGMSLFLERLKHNKYELGIGASELFEILSSDEAKDKTVKAAMDRIFEAN
jgi:DNA repair exonuclease SbcCD nuclease subunit